MCRRLPGMASSRRRRSRSGHIRAASSWVARSRPRLTRARQAPARLATRPRQGIPGGTSDQSAHSPRSRLRLSARTVHLFRISGCWRASGHPSHNHVFLAESDDPQKAFVLFHEHHSQIFFIRIHNEPLQCCSPTTGTWQASPPAGAPFRFPQT